MLQYEFDGGPSQLFVVYTPEDTGGEIDPLSIYEEIARDAAERAGRGQFVVSMTGLEARHAAVAFGREGSGYTTKVSVTVVYARAGSDEAERAGSATTSMAAEAAEGQGRVARGFVASADSGRAG